MTHVGLEDVAAVDREGIADVANRVAGQRPDVLPLAGAGRQDLQTSAPAPVKHRKGAKVGMGPVIRSRQLESVVPEQMAFLAETHPIAAAGFPSASTPSAL